jgi:anthranilate/para-aminobenzoate synthase component I|tara:strand:+ start:38 stop:331 length:294 start_codon:yes stop_codon:yes gene_type:complete
MKEVDVNKKLQSLIDSGNKAFDLLLEEVKKPIDPDLQDDKARNAMKAKKECFMDAQDILMAINKIQNQIKEGESIEDDMDLEEKSFKAGFSEKYAKK